MAGGGAVVVVPVRVACEVGEVQLGDGADLELHELGEKGVEIGDRAEIGVRDSRVNDAGMVWREGEERNVHQQERSMVDELSQRLASRGSRWTMLTPRWESSAAYLEASK